VLPSLPEVAVKVRRLVDDPEMSTAQLTRAISADPVLSARLLQISNSPFFRCLNPSVNLQSAINRLGAICVRNVVTSLVMAQLYKTNVSGLVKKTLQAQWEQSTLVAAYAHVFAGRFTVLDPEQCMVTGLVSKIGCLPFLTEAGNSPELMASFDKLLEVMEANSPLIGKIILETWDFPQEVIDAVYNHLKWDRQTSNHADLTDVITVAHLHAVIGTNDPLAKIDWAEVGAFERLNVTPERSREAQQEAQAEIMGIQKLLKG
jgi:HD-like signal output (HDOD) protein